MNFRCNLVDAAGHTIPRGRPSRDCGAPPRLRPLAVATTPVEKTPIRQLLREHRLRQGLTLEMLGSRSGISARTISDIERGVSLSPQRATAVALADALDLSEAERIAFLAAARAGRRATVSAATAVDPQPRRLADFSGREQEVARLVAALADPRPAGTVTPPIVVSGGPGTGKTSLAVEALQRRQIGDDRTRLFVDLGGVDAAPLSALEVLQSLLRQLGSASDETTSIDDAAAAWVAASATSAVVVLLDNAASESQVRPCLTADGKSAVVVTSRSNLAGLEGADHLTLGRMPRSESLLLLRRVIPAQQSLSGDLDELAQLCGDLPLALRISANRVAIDPSMTVEDFAVRLRSEDGRLKNLTATDAGVEPAFAASYDYLPEPTRDAFLSLSLLYGSSFTAPLAAAMLGISINETFDAIDDLVDLGLLEMLHGERYRLHDLLRVYAKQRLLAEVPAAEIDERSERLGAWLLATAANAGRQFAPKSAVEQTALATGFDSQGDARQWLIAESDYWLHEIRRAADEGRHNDVVVAGPAIGFFGDQWLAWGQWHELYNIVATSAAAVGATSVQINAINDRAHIEIFALFDPDRGLATSETALQIAIAHNDAEQSAWSLSYIANAQYYRDEPELALEAAQQSADAFAALGSLEGQLQPRTMLAILKSESDPVDALEEFRAVIAITDDPAAPLSDLYRNGTRLNVMGMLARTLLTLERYDEAIAASTDVINFSHHVDEGDRAKGYRHRGFAHLALGNTDSARQDLELALDLAGEQRPDWWADEIQATLAQLSETHPEHGA